MNIKKGRNGLRPSLGSNHFDSCLHEQPRPRIVTYRPAGVDMKQDFTPHQTVRFRTKAVAQMNVIMIEEMTRIRPDTPNHEFPWNIEPRAIISYLSRNPDSFPASDSLS